MGTLLLSLLLTQHGLQPQLRLAEVHVDAGPMLQQDAHQVLARRRAAFRACYTAAVYKDPSLSGRARLEVQIPAHGRAESVEVERPEAWPQALEDCLERVVMQTRFAVPEGASGVSRVRFDLHVWLEEGPPEPRTQ
ncbi:MAG: AgmX/PglI C-terminal domain-containing protein [Myxococcota bacterium]|nr:AgmX/PglI C-terminal domain-containing protein [Myxococcota bacterium]